VSNWWANKLAPQAPAPQRGGVVLPPAMPRTVQQPPHHQPPGGYQQPPQQDPALDNPNRELSMREAISRFSGGESARVEGGLSCPSCGSKTGYTEYRGMGGMSAGVMGNRPAPHCYECGFNGKFMQGDQALWA
jgi:hypothetical protein